MSVTNLKLAMLAAAAVISLATVSSASADDGTTEDTATSTDTTTDTTTDGGTDVVVDEATDEGAEEVEVVSDGTTDDTNPDECANGECYKDDELIYYTLGGGELGGAGVSAGDAQATASNNLADEATIDVALIDAKAAGLPPLRMD